MELYFPRLYVNGTLRTSPRQLGPTSGAAVPVVELGQVFLQVDQRLMKPWREQSPSPGWAGLPAVESQILEIRDVHRVLDFWGCISEHLVNEAEVSLHGLVVPCVDRCLGFTAEGCHLQMQQARRDVIDLCRDFGELLVEQGDESLAIDVLTHRHLSAA
jgi:hypothetical protein